MDRPESKKVPTLYWGIGVTLPSSPGYSGGPRQTDDEGTNQNHAQHSATIREKWVNNKQDEEADGTHLDPQIVLGHNGTDPPSRHDDTMSYRLHTHVL